LFPLLKAIGEEVDDPELLAFPLENAATVSRAKRILAKWGRCGTMEAIGLSVRR